jgi:hypothetical protein
LRIIAAYVAESPHEGVLCQLLGIHRVRHLSRYHGKYHLPVAADHQVLAFTLTALHGFYYLLGFIHSLILIFYCFYL